MSIAGLMLKATLKASSSPSSRSSEPASTFTIVRIMSIVCLRTSCRSKVEAARMLPICLIDSISWSRFVTEEERRFFSMASDSREAISSTCSSRPFRAPGRKAPRTRSPGDHPPDLQRHEKGGSDARFDEELLFERMLHAVRLGR